MRAPNLTGNTIELEHTLWALGLAAMIVVVLFSVKLVFGQGIAFWFDLAEVLPWMIAGGLCSDIMMIKIVASAINLGFAIAAFVTFRAVARKLRFAFDRKARGRGGFSLLHPGPTVWQARLLELRLMRKYARSGKTRAF